MDLLPIPDSWYVLNTSEKIKNGSIHVHQLAGKDIVVYRTQSGVVKVCEPFCMHLGAHLGYLGKIEGENIRCKFHNYCYDAEGICIENNRGPARNPKLRLKYYPSVEQNGRIYCYYSALNQEPTWNIPFIDEEMWTPIVYKTMHLDSHPQETAENSVDISHFEAVHNYQNIELIKPLEIDGHVLRVSYAADKLVFNKPLRFFFDIAVYGLGVSIVETRVPKLSLELREYILNQPLGDRKLDILLGVSLKIPAPNMAKFLSPVFKSVLERSYAWLTSLYIHQFFYEVNMDHKIWMYKKYIPNPIAGPDDKSILAYRKWCKRFYPHLVNGEGKENAS